MSISLYPCSKVCIHNLCCLCCQKAGEISISSNEPLGWLENLHITLVSHRIAFGISQHLAKRYFLFPNSQKWLLIEAISQLSTY